MRRLSGIASIARQYRWAIPVGLLLGVLIAGFFLFRWIGGWFDAPPPQTIAQASLQSMREQQRLTSFSARYVAVVTSTQDRLGGLLQAQKTMIMPGDVRYELDLSQLSDDNLSWNASSQTLSVTLPPIEISEPQIDLNAIQQYSSGRLLMSVTNAEDVLDNANREAALRSLSEQARQPMPMRLARDSARRAIARSFELPLRAAGIDASVEVGFADEARGGEQMDRSTPMNEVVGRPVAAPQR